MDALHRVGRRTRSRAARRIQAAPNRQTRRQHRCSRLPRPASAWRSGRMSRRRCVPSASASCTSLTGAAGPVVEIQRRGFRALLEAPTEAIRSSPKSRTAFERIDYPLQAAVPGQMPRSSRSVSGAPRTPRRSWPRHVRSTRPAQRSRCSAMSRQGSTRSRPVRPPCLAPRGRRQRLSRAAHRLARARPGRGVRVRRRRGHRRCPAGRRGADPGAGLGPRTRAKLRWRSPVASTTSMPRSVSIRMPRRRSATRSGPRWSCWPRTRSWWPSARPASTTTVPSRRARRS